MCIMSLKQLQEDSIRKIIKNQEVVVSNINVIIRNKTIEIIDEFSYLGHYVIRDNLLNKEIETRLSKTSAAFNMLHHIIWYLHCKRNCACSSNLILRK